MTLSFSRQIRKCGLLICLWPLLLAGQSNVEVAGLGYFGNFEMDRRLTFLSGVAESEVQALDMVKIEDTAYILLQLLKKSGYASPRVTGTVRFGEGVEEDFIWEIPFVPLEDEAGVGRHPESVRFNCDPGILNYYDSVTIDGLTAIDPGPARDFFIPSGTLFTRKKDTFYTEENLASRTSRLLSALRNEGLSAAGLTHKQVEVDTASGAVAVFLEFEEGPVHEVRSVAVEIVRGGGSRDSRNTQEFAGTLFNTTFVRERRQALLNEFYRKGYPDSQIRTETRPGEIAESGRLPVDLVFHIETGSKVELAGAVFQPEGILKPSLLQRQTMLEPGSVFDLTQVEEGRRQLLSLGVFTDVNVESESLADNRRRVIYTLVPAPEKTLSMQVGYGSYELGRVGLKWEQQNLWARAHRFEATLKRSFKSWGVSALYTVPQFFDKRVTAFARAGHEFRKEAGFDWTQSSFVFGASRQLEMPGAEISLEYGFENLETTRPTSETFAALDQATVASIALRVGLDRRDSALYPTSGYDLTTHLKVATDLLGGQSNFRKIEQSASMHRYLGASVYLHLGLRYGIVFSESPTASNLPFSERFFPGGENTVRGYQRGEATSLDENGEPIGAESYLLVNVELEQRLFDDVSLLLFWDGIALETTRELLPGEEFLQSVGIGLRWRTVVGPVRLEYGHNIDPRQSDPDGSLHLSVGFPF